MVPRTAFAGDRDIAVRVLEFLLGEGCRPLALLLPEPTRASHAQDLVAQCPFLEPGRVLWGTQFRKPDGMSKLRELELDYIISVHFAEIYPEEILSIPRAGVLNLHPAYLPHNRGWHTPSWAILEGTPIGATLHFVDRGVDTGDILHQRKLDVSLADTAHSLYGRLKELELRVFTEAWPELVSGSYQRHCQDPAAGSTHRRGDLYSERIQRIDLDEPVPPRTFLRRLRALTTNRVEEAAYYEVDGRRYRVQVSITEEPTEREG